MPCGFIAKRPLFLAAGFRALVSHDVEGARAHIRRHGDEPRRCYERDCCVPDTFSPRFRRSNPEDRASRKRLVHPGLITAERAVHHGFDLVRLAHICAVVTRRYSMDALEPGALQFYVYCVSEPVEHDVAPFCGQGVGNVRADSACGTGDERSFSFQHVALSRFWRRDGLRCCPVLVRLGCRGIADCNGTLLAHPRRHSLENFVAKHVMMKESHARVATHGCKKAVGSRAMKDEQGFPQVEVAMNERWYRPEEQMKGLAQQQRRCETSQRLKKEQAVKDIFEPRGYPSLCIRHPFRERWKFRKCTAPNDARQCHEPDHHTG